MKLHKVQCFNKCSVSAERGRGLGPLNSSIFGFLHAFLTRHRGFITCTWYNPSAQCPASQWKARTCFFFVFFPFSNSCLAISSSLSRLTDATPNCPKWKSIPQRFSLLLSFKCLPCGHWSRFSLSKLFLPHQQCFGIWSLDGNVSIRVHTTLLAQIEVLSQVVFSKFIVQAGWWWVPTGPYSGSLCRIGSLCSKQGPSTM